MLRLIGSSIGGTVCGLACFLFSQSLISDFEKPREAFATAVRLEFIREVPEHVTRVKERRMPQKSPPVVSRPRLAASATRTVHDVTPLPIKIDMPAIEIPLGVGHGPYLGDLSPGQAVADGDLIPLVQISPRYPSYAMSRNIEGWVNLEFTIRADGSVADPIVLESVPPRVFDHSAIRAILRWKFKPRVVNGQPVDSRGQQLMSFNLVDPAN